MIVSSGRVPTSKAGSVGGLAILQPLPMTEAAGTSLSKYNYCPQCGGPTSARPVGGRLRDACEACGRVYYSNPTPAAAAVLVEDDRILLARRASSVLRGRWYIPAGFVENDETVQQCCVREAKEETGLAVELVRLLHVHSGFDVPGRPVIGIYFLVQQVSGSLAPGSDVDLLEFYPLASVPDLPFEGDRQVVSLLRGESLGD